MRQLEIAKKSNDRKIVSDIQKRFVRLVTFNGAGFDLYFILDKILQVNGFATLYEIKNIFKGNKLVYFALYSLKHKAVVLQSFDIYQIVAPASLM